MTEALPFLKSLAKNNNRDWFLKNKHRYLDAKNNFDDLLEKIHGELVRFDESLAGLNPRKLAFRIYRDVRFSKDKRPYKNHLGAGFSEHGKMEQEPGYYVHVEPGNKSFVAGGIYMPNPENLAKIRQEIDYNSGRLVHLMKAASFRKYFSGLDAFDRLKTAPKGFAKDHPQIELLKNRSFVVSHSFADAEVVSAGFARKVAGVCRAMKPLNDFLKEAIS